MNRWSLEDPWVLWVVGPVCLLWMVAWLVRRRRAGGVDAALRYSSLRHFGALASSTRLRLHRLLPLLRVAVVALLLIAMARPQTGRQAIRSHNEVIDIVLVLDASGSMQALDLDADLPISRRRNRLEVVKDVVERFIAERSGDQLGLVVFGEEAYTQCPLTLDHGVLRGLMSRVQIGVAGDATAIGSAIATAVKRLRDSQARSKVVILLTDGRSNAGAIAPAKAAEVAAALGVKIYAIGAGTRGEAPFLLSSPLGRRVVWQNVEIDEETLRGIAGATGGRYYRAEDRVALEQIYEEIDRLERTEVPSLVYVRYRDRFSWFVLPAIGLLLAEVLLSTTLLRRLP